MSKKTDALLGRLKTVLETEADKDAARERARVQAIVRTLIRWIGKLDESTRAAIFAGIEEVATTRDRSLIAEHALRPASTDTQSAMTLRAVRATPRSEVGASPKAE